MTEDQIKHMVQRFLQWRLPENFSPDAGITFKKTFNENSPFGPMEHKPIGTNLFDAIQAEAMIRHMVDALPVQTFKSCEKHPERYCNCEGFYPACRDVPPASAVDIGRPVPKHGSGP